MRGCAHSPQEGWGDCPMCKTIPLGQGGGNCLSQEACYGERRRLARQGSLAGLDEKSSPYVRADWAFHMAYIADLRGWRDGSISIFCDSGIHMSGERRGRMLRYSLPHWNNRAGAVGRAERRHLPPPEVIASATLPAQLSFEKAAPFCWHIPLSEKSERETG